MAGKFKAMTLISEAELARMRDRQLTEYNPSVRSMTKLEALINKVFDDNTLSPDEKQKILNTLHERFSQLYSKYKNSSSSTSALTLLPNTPPPSLADTAETNEEESERDVDSVQEQQSDTTVDTSTGSDSSYHFPQIDLADKFARKLGLFKDFLKANRNVLAASPKNELVVDGKLIPNSSFSDLVRSMYIRGTKLNVTGSNEFINKLAGLRVDPTMFSNSDKILILTSGSDLNRGPKYGRNPQQGKGHKRNFSISHSSAPPGKLPRILRLFRV